MIPSVDGFQPNSLPICRCGIWARGEGDYSVQMKAGHRLTCVTVEPVQQYRATSCTSYKTTQPFVYEGGPSASKWPNSREFLNWGRSHQAAVIDLCTVCFDKRPFAIRQIGQLPYQPSWSIGVLRTNSRDNPCMTAVRTLLDGINIDQIVKVFVAEGFRYWTTPYWFQIAFTL